MYVALLSPRTSPYLTSLHFKINMHKRNNTKNSTNNKKHGKYKYTYYQNMHTLENPHTYTPTHYKTHIYTHPHITKPTYTHTHTLQNPHIHTHTHTHTNTLQNKLKQPQYNLKQTQYKIRPNKISQNNQVPSV